MRQQDAPYTDFPKVSERENIVSGAFVSRLLLIQVLGH